MLPDGAVSTEAVPAAFAVREEGTRGPLMDYEQGGDAIGDASSGLSSRLWAFWLEGGWVRCRRLDDAEAPAVALVEASGATEVTGAFDQAMRPVVVVVVAGDARLHWHDATMGTDAVLSLPGAVSPVLALDERREEYLAASDVLLSYAKAGQLCVRMQRERFLVEHVVAPLPARVTRVDAFGLNRAGRMQWRFKRAL